MRADLIRKMMSSQLGRMILNGSASTEDEMSARPDAAGNYGQLDVILKRIAERAIDHSQDPAASTVGT